MHPRLVHHKLKLPDCDKSLVLKDLSKDMFTTQKPKGKTVHCILTKHVTVYALHHSYLLLFHMFGISGLYVCSKGHITGTWREISTQCLQDRKGKYESIQKRAHVSVSLSPCYCSRYQLHIKERANLIIKWNKPSSEVKLL